MSRDELIEMAKQKAAEAGLDPALLLGLLEQESNFNEFALRYEPGFMGRYIQSHFLKGEFDATEAYARAFSWGLGQIMGQVAREHGFKGVFLAELCDPWNNLTLVCQILTANLKRTGGDVTQALLHYNGGGAPNYAEEVLAKAEKYKGV